MDTIKVLYILPSLNLCGGIESFAMNYYRHVDDDISIDFITHDCHDRDLYDEIVSSGHEVTVLPPFGLRTLGACLGGISAFFADHPDYDIVHCHMANAAPFYFKAAKKHGDPKLIIHSHQDNYADKKLHALRNIPLIKKGVRLATHRAACTRQAGDFLFKGLDYQVITNAIEPGHYTFDDAARTRIRGELGLASANILIGTVGRLTEQKNPLFLLDIMSKLPENYHLVYVGEGHLDEAIKSKASSLQLSDRIHLVGSTNDVAGFMSAMDIFILPSLYEGLGIVNIEAQSSGLPTIVSDRVPKDADMGELFVRLPLEAPIEKWTDQIMASSKNAAFTPAGYRNDQKWIQAVSEHGYDIDKEAIKLAEYYHRVLGRG